MGDLCMKDRAYIHDNEYYHSIIRTNIRKFRLEQSLTQQDLADMIKMSREYICDIENEHRNKHLTIAVLGRIAIVYKYYFYVCRNLSPFLQFQIPFFFSFFVFNLFFWIYKSICFLLKISN